jgi:hypothetical protein
VARSLENAMNQQPIGWPAHFHPHVRTNHRPRTINGVELWPYDVTKSRVYSWVCIQDGKYLGIIGKARNQSTYQVHKEGGDKSKFAFTLHKASLF